MKSHTITLQMYYVMVLLATVACCVQGCDLRRLGPPIPELFAKEYMLANGYDANVIQAVLEYKQLPSETIVRLLKESDNSTKHMIGRNAYLTQDERKQLINDRDSYVRSGVAMNPSLSSSEIDTIRKDKSVNVLHGLAMNPFVSSNLLIVMWREHRVPDSALAKNPLCPDEIVQAIQKNGGSLEKDLLRIGQRERQKGTYLGRILPETKRSERTATEGPGATDKTARHRDGPSN